jgi:hypothetical protein
MNMSNIFKVQKNQWVMRKVSWETNMTYGSHGLKSDNYT